MYLGMENAQHRMVGHLPRRIKISEPESNLEVHARSKVCESHVITQILYYIISYVYRHMDYGILETTYHFSEPRFPKENFHEFVICSIHMNCTCFLNGTNMADQNVIPQKWMVYNPDQGIWVKHSPRCPFPFAVLHRLVLCPSSAGGHHLCLTLDLDPTDLVSPWLWSWS